MKVDPRAASDPEAASRRLERLLEHRGFPTVERMRQRRLGLHPLEPELRQRQRAEERRRERERVHGRTDVVHESGKCELGRAQSAAQCGLRLA